MNARLFNERLILTAAVACLPLLLATAVLRLYGLTWVDLVPVYSDEVFYWHQAASFRAVGFNSGYYTVNEQPAAADWGRFYAWGVAIPAFYGSIGRLIGWPLWAMPSVNIALLTGGLLVFLLLARSRRRDVLLLAAALMTFPPFLLLFFASMMPVAEMGIALLLGGLLLAWQRTRDARWLGLLLVSIALASLLRATWALLFVPALLVAAETRRGVLAALSLALLLNLLLWALFLWSAAPFPYPITQALRERTVEAWAHYGQHLLNNLHSLTRGTTPEVIQRVQMGLVIAALGWFGWRVRPMRRLAWGMVLAMSAWLAFALLVHDAFDWRDYRLVAPLLLLGIGLLAAMRRWQPLTAVVLLSLVALPSTLRLQADWLPQQAQAKIALDAARWQRALGAVIAHDPQAPSPWCSTLTFTIGYFDQPALLLGVPAGVGLSSPLFEAPRLPHRARWLLLDGGYTAQHRAALDVQPLLPVPGGALYRNRAADCPP